MYVCVYVWFHILTCWPTATRHPSRSGCQGRSRTFLPSPNKNKSTASAEASWSWALSWLRYWFLIKYMIFAHGVEQFETEATKLLRDDVKCRTVATWVLMEQLAANTWDVRRFPAIESASSLSLWLSGFQANRTPDCSQHQHNRVWEPSVEKLVFSWLEMKNNW